MDQELASVLVEGSDEQVIAKLAAAMGAVPMAAYLEAIKTALDLSKMSNELTGWTVDATPMPERSTFRCSHDPDHGFAPVFLESDAWLCVECGWVYIVANEAPDTTFGVEVYVV